MFGKHLIDVDSLSLEEVQAIIESAEQFLEVNLRDVKKVPSLRGKTIVNLFLEPSTRTRVSFEIAGKRLSADTINIGGKDSSVSKGETLIDTARNIEAMNTDILVMRHSSSGAPLLLSNTLKNISIVNAGDGLHAHPTQALLDLLTIKQRLKRITDLKITFVGDIFRSRVARSNILLHQMLGNQIRVVTPETLNAEYLRQLSVDVYTNLEEGIKDADIVMTFRMKHEYLKDFYVPSLSEYSRQFCISEKSLRVCPNAVVMAPGPIMRGIEIDSVVADSPRALITEQVNSGVAIRMAVLFLIATNSSNKKEIVNE